MLNGNLGSCRRSERYRARSGCWQRQSWLCRRGHAESNIPIGTPRNSACPPLFYIAVYLLVQCHEVPALLQVVGCRDGPAAADGKASQQERFVGSQALSFRRDSMEVPPH